MYNYSKATVETRKATVTRNDKNATILQGYDSKNAKWVGVLEPSDNMLAQAEALQLGVEFNGLQGLKIITDNDSAMYNGTVHRFNTDLLFDFSQHVIDCTEIQFRDDGTPFIECPFKKPVTVSKTRGTTQAKIDSAVNAANAKADADMRSIATNIAKARAEKKAKPGTILKELQAIGMNGYTVTDIEEMIAS